MRDVRPNQPYGARTGYVSRVRNNLEADPADGRWHTFVVEVDSVDKYRLFVDGRLVADVVEKLPATIDPGPVSVGLRLDFCDVELGPMRLEEGGDMIPGVANYHPREAWQDPRYPVFGPLDNPRDNDTVVIHYTAASKIPADIAGYLRAIQRDYTLNRGYSIGYSFAVDQDGGVWQLRGWEYQSAANRDHNGHTVPILMLVDGAGMASDKAAASVRAIVAEAQRRSGRKMSIVGHGQLSGAATSCPGVGLRTQIAAGVFVPTPPPPPAIGGHSVFQKLIRLDGTPAVYAQYSGGYKTWIPTEAALAAFRNISGKDVEVIPASLSALFVATGPIQGPIPPGVDAWGLPTG